MHSYNNRCTCNIHKGWPCPFHGGGSVRAVDMLDGKVKPDSERRGDLDPPYSPHVRVLPVRVLSYEETVKAAGLSERVREAQEAVRVAEAEVAKAQDELDRAEAELAKALEGVG